MTESLLLDHNEPAASLTDRDYAPPPSEERVTAVSNTASVSFTIPIYRRTLTTPLGRSLVSLRVRSEDEEHWLLDAIAQLNRISDLPSNWDTYGAPAVPQRTINLALEALAHIVVCNVPKPRILASSQGGIEFLWDVNGRELEITLNSDFEGEIYYLDETNDSEEEVTYRRSFEKIREYAARLVG